MEVYIVPGGSVTQEMIDAAIVDSSDTLRHSVLAPDRVVMKVEDPGTAFVGYIPLTITEALSPSYLGSADWNESLP